jgi:pimeloyl-ACP methyl ester carboxylesterase
MHELRLAGFPEPLGLWQRRVPPPGGAPDVRAYRLEYSSRGDRVAGRLWLPRHHAGDCPLLLLQPAGGPAESTGVERIGAAWTERGVALASIDLPLRGARSDPKLSALVGTPFEPGSLASGDALRFELARQAIIDLERALDALCTLEAIDRERIAFVGLGLGAMLGAAFCALDPRPRGAALVGAGAGLAAAEVDPGTYIGRFAPRPLLLLHARRGGVPTRAAEALAAAAGKAVEQAWLDEAPDPETALPVCWEFLARVLGLEPVRSV